MAYSRPFPLVVLLAAFGCSDDAPGDTDGADSSSTSTGLSTSTTGEPTTDASSTTFEPVTSSSASSSSSSGDEAGDSSSTSTAEDECATDNGGCAQICVDRPDGFICECEAGYAVEDDGASCDDIDECATDNGGCEQTCTNSEASFECSCDDGYVLGRDGAACDDIDECAVDNGGCDQVCSNEPGEFSCSCEDGFAFAKDGVTCEDVNECETDNGGCEDVCTNAEGSFACSCTAGVLSPDGLSCEPTTVFFTTLGTGTVARVASDGTGLATLVTGLSSPFGVEVDIPSTNIFYGAFGLGTSEADGSNQVVLSTAGSPSGVALDADNQHLYWSDFDGNTISRMDYDGENAVVLIDTGISDPTGIDIDLSTGRMFFGGYNDGRILSAALDGSDLQFVDPGVGAQPADVAVNEATGIVYVAARDSAVYSIAADLTLGSVATVVGGQGVVQGVAVATSEGKLYWSSVELGGSAIRRADFDGGNVEAVAVVADENVWDVAVNLD